MLNRFWMIEDNPPTQPTCFVIPSYALKSATLPTLPTRKQIELAYEWWKKFPQAKLIMSTGDNQMLGITNAKVMADYAISLSASRSYLERWRYGATLKYAGSHLIQNKSAAMLLDFGLMYADTNSQWYAGAVVKNAGIQLQKYDINSGTQPLPIDVQIGIVKKFKKAPFSLSVLAHHLYTWDIRYDNPADQVDNSLLFNDNTQDTKKKSYFADKLFRHFVFALDINLGRRLELSAGYNHLRRSELAIAEKKGLSGFSFGGGLYLNKFVIHFAQSYYHISGAYSEVGINFALNQLFGMGKGGNKINWSEKFANQYK